MTTSLLPFIYIYYTYVNTPWAKPNVAKLLIDQLKSGKGQVMKLESEAICLFIMHWDTVSAASLKIVHKYYIAIWSTKTHSKSIRDILNFNQYFSSSCNIYLRKVLLFCSYNISKLFDLMPPRSVKMEILLTCNILYNIVAILF